MDEQIQYQQAQSWYRQLKEKFADQLAEAAEATGEQQTLQLLDELSFMLTNVQSTKGQAQSKLHKILDKYMKEITDSGFDIKAQAAKIVKELKESGEQVENQERYVREKLVEQIVQQFKDNDQLKQMLLTALKSQMGAGQRGVRAETRFSALLDKTVSLLRRGIVEMLYKHSQSYYLTIITAAGYIQEDMEYEALSKAFKNVSDKVRVRPGGAIKDSTGKETHADNLIMVQDLLKDYETAFTQQTDVVRKNPLNMTAQDQRALLREINYFGEQVKTFSLNQDYPHTGDLYGLRISNQTAMFREYEAETNVSGKNMYDIWENIKFLGRYKNILRSFGADTLMFATSDGRYFMDDFIQEFRTKNYLLVFGLSNTTNQLTDTVVLEKPYGKKNKLRSMYYTT